MNTIRRLLLLTTLFMGGISGAQLLYITNEAGNTVTVVDPSTGITVAVIPTGWAPTGIVANRAGSKVYVVNCGSLCTLSGGDYDNAVSVIDTATRAVTDVIRVGEDPTRIAINPEETRLYVTNHQDNTVSVISTSTNEVIATIPVLYRPTGIAVHPNGAFVYVSSGEANSLDVIDAATNSVVATVPGVGGPSVALNPQGTFAYIATDGPSEFVPGTVSVVSTLTNSLVASIQVGNFPYAVAVEPTGALVYVANYNSGTVSVIDAATTMVTATIPVGASPRAIAVDASGSFAYVANGSSNSVSVVDLATNTVRANIGAGVSPVGLVITRPPWPQGVSDCQGGKWRTVRRPDGSTFRNQGDCIQFVHTGR